MTPKLVFFGNERLATGVTTTVPTLQALLAAGYDIAAVVVAQKEPQASRRGRDLEIAEVAAQHNIPVLAPGQLLEARDQIANYVALAGILVAYGKIVPPEIIDLFPSGIINIHPSLLPKHRGPAPIESAILQGDTETGVSLMQLTANMDAGPVYAQETVLLRGDEVKQVLADQLLGLGKDMLLHYLPDILSGKAKPSPQNDTQASYDKRIDKGAGELDFERKSAVELAREVRAYAGWPRSRAMIGTTEVIITAAHADEAKGVPGTLLLANQQLGLHAAEGTLLIDRLIPVGKQEMLASAFLTGYRIG